MTLQKKANLRLCAALGAGIGAGQALFRDTSPSIHWLWAIILCTVVSGLAAWGASFLVNRLITSDEEKTAAN